MKLVLLLLYFVKYVIIVKTIYSVLLKGSKSAEGSPYPLADLDRGVQFQGGPNPLGHRHNVGHLVNCAVSLSLFFSFLKCKLQNDSNQC